MLNNSRGPNRERCRVRGAPRQTQLAPMRCIVSARGMPGPERRRQKTWGDVECEQDHTLSKRTVVRLSVVGKDVVF